MRLIIRHPKSEWRAWRFAKSRRKMQHARHECVVCLQDSRAAEVLGCEGIGAVADAHRKLETGPLPGLIASRLTVQGRLMRRIINSTFITLDGVIANPHTWPSGASAIQRASRSKRTCCAHAMPS